MNLLLQISTVFLVAVAMVPAVVHALELPGKMRLDRQAYLTVQPIYYPGFTVVGGAAEVLGTILDARAARDDAAIERGPRVDRSGLRAAAGDARVYWMITHPVNRVLSNRPMRWVVNEQAFQNAASYAGVLDASGPL